MKGPTAKFRQQFKRVRPYGTKEKGLERRRAACTMRLETKEGIIKISKPYGEHIYFLYCLF